MEVAGAGWGWPLSLQRYLSSGPLDAGHNLTQEPVPGKTKCNLVVQPRILCLSQGALQLPNLLIRGRVSRSGDELFMGPSLQSCCLTVGGAPSDPRRASSRGGRFRTAPEV